jgi:arylsulfatase
MQDPYAFTQRGYQRGFTGTILPSAATNMFNLYTNPQEDDSIALRQLPVYLLVSAEADAFSEILVKFPPAASHIAW